MLPRRRARATCGVLTRSRTCPPPFGAQRWIHSTRRARPAAKEKGCAGRQRRTREHHPQSTEVLQPREAERASPHRARRRGAAKRSAENEYTGKDARRTERHCRDLPGEWRFVRQRVGGQARRCRRGPAASGRGRGQQAAIPRARELRFVIGEHRAAAGCEQCVRESFVPRRDAERRRMPRRTQLRVWQRQHLLHAEGGCTDGGVHLARGMPHHCDRLRRSRGL